jgi:hypothetical protein
MPEAGARWARLLAWALGALAALSLLVAMWPEPKAQPLLGADGIVSESGFIRTDLPKEYEARDSVRQSPALATWRTWTPDKGSVPGAAHSQPFRMPEYLLVPYQGFAGDPGISLQLECIASGARVDVAIARTNTQWSEALVRRPANWCAGDSRLVSRSDSTDKYVAFGTPFRLSTISWLKAHFPGLFGLWVLAFASFSGLCLLAARGVARWQPAADPVVAGCIALGVTGFAAFVLYQYLRAIAIPLAFAASFAGWWTWWRFAREAQGTAPASAVFDAWRWPLLAWAMVSLFYLALVYAADNGAGAWLVNARFTPVRWSTDNQLPMLAGEYLARRHLSEIDIRPWQISDRTPLIYGLLAWWRRISLLLLRVDDGRYMAVQMHTLAGIVVNSLWAPVLTHVLRKLGLSWRRVALALLAAALLPFCIFNSTYIWPKLLGGSFALLALGVLLLRTAPTRNAGWIAAAALSALALLCHGGTVFGILAMLVLAPFLRGLPGPRAIIGCALVVAALLGPWSAWQKLVQPPGTALMKSVFAGTYGFDEPQVGVLDTVKRSYAGIDGATWRGMKLDGLRSIVLPATPQTCAQGEMAVRGDGVRNWRVVDFISLFPSLKFLWLGVLAIPLLARSSRASLRAPLLLLGAGLLGVAFDVLLAWDCQVIHTQSYESILAIIAGLLALVLLLPARWPGLLVAALVAGYGLWVWVIEPLQPSTYLDPIALLACALLLVAAARLALAAPAAEAEAAT